MAYNSNEHEEDAWLANPFMSTDEDEEEEEEVPPVGGTEEEEYE